MKVKHIILFLLIIMLLIPTAISCGSKDNAITSNLRVARSNLVNSDGWAYYRNAAGVYKIRPDGTDKTLVLDIPPLLWQVYEDRIYYIPFENIDGIYMPHEAYGMYISDEEEDEIYYSIYSCNTDGSDNEFICKTPLTVPSETRTRLNVAHGWIYLGFERDGKVGNYDLYRINVDGTGMTMVNPGEECFFDFSIDDDGWIYYITIGGYEGKQGAQLWHMHHDGTEKQQLMQEVSWAIDYTDNEIFYIDMSENRFCGDIYAVSRDGAEKRKVAECEANSAWSFIKVIGDWVYYIDTGDNPGVYKVKTDGSERTRISILSELGFTRLVVIDNWLSYLSVDREYLEMIRISDMYETDDLLDQIHEDQLESALFTFDTDDPFYQWHIDRFYTFEVRKYE